MRWLERIGLGLGIFVVLLLLAAVGARTWFARQIPRLEREADAAWAKAGIPVEELPKRFPDTENNDDARWLEAMAAKLEIPVFSDPACTYSSDELAKRGKLHGYEVDLECAKRHASMPGFKLADALRQFLRKQMERTAGTPEAPPAEIGAYLRAHRGDFDELVAGIRSRTPVWFARRHWWTDQPDYLMLAHLEIGLAADAYARGAENPGGPPMNHIGALRDFERLFMRRGRIADLLFAIGFEREALALERTRATMGGTDGRTAGTNFRAAFPIALELEDRIIWRPSYEEEGILSDSYPFPSGWAKHFNPLASWLLRPWRDASLLEMHRLEAKDAERIRLGNPCEPGQTDAKLLRMRFGRHTIRHRDLSWWNVTGAVAYAMAFTNSGSLEMRVNRNELEQELTDRIRMAVAARDGLGRIPMEIAGFSDSRCGAMRWKLTAKPDGGAVIDFVNPPDFEIKNGAQIPLRYELPGPARR